MNETQSMACEVPQVLQSSEIMADATSASMVPYDENLLERARNQWQFGDWQSLSQLSRESLQHHPDRAKLILMAAAGNLQMGNSTAARQFIRQAQNWGVCSRLINQILIAGVHNSLGRAAILSQQHRSALHHFERAVAIGTPGADEKLLSQARMHEQICQLGVAVNVITSSFSHNKKRAGITLLAEPHATTDELPLADVHRAWQIGRWEFLTKFDNAELVGRPHQANLALYAACGYQQLDNMDGLHRCTRLAQEWGCSSKKIKQFLAAGIHNTLAVAATIAGQYENAAKNFVAALTVESSSPKLPMVKSRIRQQLKMIKKDDHDFDNIITYLTKIIQH